MVGWNLIGSIYLSLFITTADDWAEQHVSDSMAADVDVTLLSYLCITKPVAHYNL